MTNEYSSKAEETYNKVSEIIRYNKFNLSDSEAIQAIVDLITQAQIVELKRSLNKGYFIPEMEVIAENRILELESTLKKEQ